MKLIFKLHGRLGNLFYIFSAFYYALKHNVNSYLILDASDYIFEYLNGDKYLNIFYNKIKNFIVVDYNTKKSIDDYVYEHTDKHTHDYIELENIINDNYNTTNVIYFDVCFFQTCKYFLKYKNDIKKYFINETNNVNKYKFNITNNDVLIHVRQGDYYISGCYVLNKEYYIDMYNNYFKGKNIYITSDDIEWCKQNLKINRFIKCKNIHYICDLSPIETITLAQYFSNFICSNSTFAMMCELFSNDENKKVVGVKNVSPEIIRNNAFDDNCIIYDLNENDNYKYISNKCIKH